MKPSQHHPKSVHVITIAILIGITQPLQAQIGIGIMGGAQRLTSPLTMEKKSRARLEGEFFASGLLGNHLELGLSFGGSSLGSNEESYVSYDRNTTYYDTYEDRYYTFDIRLNARLYPFANSDSIVQPYVGTGIGYYWMKHYWKDTYTETTEYFDYIETYEDVYEGNGTLAKGFFTYASLGTDIKLMENLALNLEYRQDFQKKDNDWDLGGPMFMIGLRMRL